MGNGHDKRPSFTWTNNVANTPWERVAQDIKFTRVGLIMMTLHNVQMPSTNRTMFTHQRKDRKEGDGRMWVYFCNTWNPTSLVMDAKTSQTTSWDTVLSLPWAHWKRWISKGSNGWPQMQWDRARIKGWGRPNMVHNAKEKTFEGKYKHGITRWANNQIIALGPT